MYVCFDGVGALVLEVLVNEIVLEWLVGVCVFDGVGALVLEVLVNGIVVEVLVAAIVLNKLVGLVVVCLSCPPRCMYSEAVPWISYVMKGC